MLGTWAVKCYQPNSNVFHHGVISPVAPNASLLEIISYISVNDPKCEIVNVQRLKRIGATWEDSATLKITFKGADKADSVTIGKSFYRVRPYVSEPTQCYNCQRLGHTSHSFREKTRCLVCGKEHRKEFVQQQLSAALTGGAHKTNSKTCPLIAQACEIKKNKVYNNKTQEARQ